MMTPGAVRIWLKISLLALLLLPVCFSPHALALQADELLLIVNKRVPESRKLAEYYMGQRQIPVDQLIEVSMSKEEECSRVEYREQLARPVRKYLATHKDKSIRCLVLFYGLPLRVSAPALTEQQARQLKELEKQFASLKDRMARDQDGGDNAALKQLKNRIRRVRGRERVAALDSELALVRAGDYPLERWRENPFYIGFQKRKTEYGIDKASVLFVSRLDGPDADIVRRLIDDSLAAEGEGLQGKAYFDARWPAPGDEKLSAYALYDASLHRAAALTRKISALEVIVDHRETLFQAGEAEDAGLYCGWYSLGRYVDAFDWRRGAVAYHIASSECTTLKKPDSRVWCKALLEDGVAATLGPVAEPYVQGFPLPELFFGYLLDGYYTLAESYFLSLPYLSWQMILIGDPLYRPFRNIP